MKGEPYLRSVNTQEGNGGIMIGVGAGLTLVVLLVLQSVTTSGVFGTKIETVTVTVTPTKQATDLVSGNYANHMLLIESRNVSAIVRQYEGNATLTWTGQGGTKCPPRHLRGHRKNNTSPRNFLVPTLRQ